MSPRMLQRDASCPNGGVFYSCNKGFVGCCLVEACNPGVRCPADKDRTPDGSSSKDASTTTTVITSTVPAAPISSTTTTSVTLLSTTTSEPVSTSLLASSTNRATAAESPAPAAALSAEHSHDSGNATPTAAIVGGVLGGIILISIIVGLLFCIRRRKRTKVYKAAVCPSPHVGSDMSPHPLESRVSRFAGLVGKKQKFVHHIDSRQVAPPAEMDGAPQRHSLCTELPASNNSIRNVLMVELM
ncbi:hypothetical protein BU25DRAFT_217662 [Macroventuria anomochaeta]|uniref:Uncharacterized protein n=1 Tax=Macroventuria anomochaeta TaxID=301207 RepID=A0ACB6RKU9_9PLEO|nr:uncharacterized protein BU25DRAFT_217662 [Macroventuria anomochaeta]KAF2622030.1 hypothetical protein BU25DRAFT_217662 [Macroventuria anomochaeta]